MRNHIKENNIRKFTHKMQASLLLVFCVIILLFVALIGRLIYLNNKDGDKYAKRVLSQQTYVSTVIPYQRGEILDRNGTKLATSEKVYNLVLDPKTLLSKDTYLNPTLKALTKCFDLTKEEINEILETKPDSQYIVLLKELTYDEVTPFKELASENKLIKGIWFEEEYKRIYPYSTLASHIIGFTTKGNVGNWGLEQYYNDELNGSTGREYGYFDSELNLERNVKDAVNGNSLVTTIDTNIQTIVQKHIDKFEEEVGSKTAAVIVMNPNNGEIYAMASNNEYDLNNPRDLTGFYTKKEIKKMSEDEKLEALNAIWRNFMISDTFEPGSTYKPMTVAAGFEEAVLNGNETYFCPGYKVVNGQRIHCSHRQGHGRLTLKEVIMESCNVGLMEIVEKEGKKVFSKYQNIFGLSSKTGIDLPGEQAGILYSLDKMSTVDLATNSFGQNFTVNMVQMASAFSSLVNGGHYYQPHLVKQIVNDKGATVKNIGATLIKETVSEKTSEILKDYLYATVESGTATGAQVEGVQVGGKTGTAQKYPREDKNYLVSFIGAAPAYDPEVVIYVVIDELNLDRQDQSGYATRLAGEILTEILPFLGIYPDTSSDTSTDDKSQAVTNESDTSYSGTTNDDTSTTDTTDNSTGDSNDDASTNQNTDDNTSSDDSDKKDDTSTNSEDSDSTGSFNETDDTDTDDDTDDNIPANDDLLGNTGSNEEDKATSNTD